MFYNKIRVLYYTFVIATVFCLVGSLGLRINLFAESINTQDSQNSSISSQNTVLESITPPVAQPPITPPPVEIPQPPVEPNPIENQPIVPPAPEIQPTQPEITPPLNEGQHEIVLKNPSQTQQTSQLPSTEDQSDISQPVSSPQNNQVITTPTPIDNDEMYLPLVDNNPQPFDPHKILINEFSVKDTTETPLKEWVELFNNLGAEIDITGWYFTDGLGTKVNITTTNTQVFDSNENLISGLKVPVGGFVVCTRGSGWLNDSVQTGESESVLLYNSSKVLIDKVTVYSNEYPTNGQSTARIIDASEQWENRETVDYTKGKTNVLPLPPVPIELPQSYITAEQIAGNPNGNTANFDGYCGSITSDQSVIIGSSIFSSINMRFANDPNAIFYRITEYSVVTTNNPATLKQTKSTYLFYPNDPSKSTLPTGYSTYLSTNFYGINGYIETEDEFIWKVEGVNSVGQVVLLSNTDPSTACTITYKKPIQADLSLAIAPLSQSQFHVSDRINYTINVTDNGPDTSTAVVLRYQFPLFLNIQTVQIGTLQISPVVSSQNGFLELAIPIDEIKSGESISVHIQGTIQQTPAGKYNYKFSVKGTQIDPDITNNIKEDWLEIVQSQTSNTLSPQTVSFASTRRFVTRPVIYRIIKPAGLIRSGGSGVSPR